jgi:putative redox protein
MVHIDITYEGGLRTRAVHPSGTELITDAPVDNQGKGESFSPTDLLATSVGSCMLTIMGIVADRHEWGMQGATARVEKSMAADPKRRVSEVSVTITVPGTFDAKARTALERAAMTCPVHTTLGGRVELPVTFHWDS